jgi:sugar/nucleoside kinase (ribokinase family)
MKVDNLMNNKVNSVCVGTGLVALDVVISSNADHATRFYAGGSCGNVIAILSYLGWNSYPIARLSNNPASSLLMEDLQKWHVKADLLTFTDDGSTPIIIHRILKDSSGAPKHRFEFRNPEDGTYLPSYKPCLSKAVPGIVETGVVPNVFYFDRINRASMNLAKEYKDKGAIIFFEPSSMKDLKGFEECLILADVVKFSHDRISGYEGRYATGQCFLEIQTLGNAGLKFRTKSSNRWLNLSGYSIDNVIDSAGAGDWCTAGIIINLFSAGVKLQSLSKEDISTALQFGQALSALNCTFEGARGLMYNIGRNDLILSVQHIINSHLKKIPQRNRPLQTYHNPNKEVKISSLFATV